MEVWNMLHAAYWKYRTQKWRKNRHAHHCTTLSGWIFATDMYQQSEKNVKQQYLECPHNMANFGPLAAEIGSGVWAFHQISTGFAFGFVSGATSFTGSQPNFARCLAVSCAGILYIHFRRLLPLSEFCQLQNSLCVQVYLSHIFAALLHGTWATGVSQSLRRGTRNGITELSQKAPPIFGRAAITLGIGPHSS